MPKLSANGDYLVMVHIPSDEYERLAGIARVERRSVANLAAILVTDGLAMRPETEAEVEAPKTSKGRKQAVIVEDQQ